MKNCVVPLVIALALAACSDRQPEPDAAIAQSARPVTSAGASQASSACTDSASYSPLPGGVAIKFPFHLRSDRIAADQKGRMKRRVVLEVIDGDTASSFESAKASMLAAGYQLSGERKGDPASKQSQKFKKKGAQNVYLTSSIKVGKKPANPAAVGVVSFDWALPDQKPAGGTKPV